MKAAGALKVRSGTLPCCFHHVLWCKQLTSPAQIQGDGK
jgi:hypothetical protein